MLLNKFKLNWKYALGEILLISIGVMLALAVDGWREYQEERKLESEYVSRIDNDLRSALSIWENHTARLESAVSFLEDLRNGKEGLVTPDNVQNVWNAYMVSHWFAPPAIRSSAFEELVSTGRLSIIEDVAFRDSISTFYTDYSSIADMAAQMVDNSYTRFCNSVIPYDVFRSGQVLQEYDVAKIRESFQDLSSRPEFSELSNVQLSTHISNIQFIAMYSDIGSELLAEIAAQEDH